VRKTTAMAGSVGFFVLRSRDRRRLGSVAVDRWRLGVLPPYALPGRVLGMALVASGVAVVVHAFARFVLEGAGTPAPVAPPEQLVVGGLYRYVAAKDDVLRVWPGLLAGFPPPPARSPHGAHLRGRRDHVIRLGVDCAVVVRHLEDGFSTSNTARYGTRRSAHPSPDPPLEIAEVVAAVEAPDGLGHARAWGTG
jgi:hypothetical protein